MKSFTFQKALSAPFLPVTIIQYMNESTSIDFTVKNCKQSRSICRLSEKQIPKSVIVRKTVRNFLNGWFATNPWRPKRK